MPALSQAEFVQLQAQFFGPGQSAAIPFDAAAFGPVSALVLGSVWRDGKIVLPPLVWHESTSSLHSFIANECRSRNCEKDVEENLEVVLASLFTYLFVPRPQFKPKPKQQEWRWLYMFAHSRMSDLRGKNRRVRTVVSLDQPEGTWAS